MKPTSDNYNRFLIIQLMTESMNPIAIIQSNQFVVTEQGLCAQTINRLYKLDGLAADMSEEEPEVKGYQDAQAQIVHYYEV